MDTKHIIMSVTSSILATLIIVKFKMSHHVSNRLSWFNTVFLHFVFKYSFQLFYPFIYMLCFDDKVDKESYKIYAQNDSSFIILNHDTSFLCLVCIYEQDN